MRGRKTSALKRAQLQRVRGRPGTEARSVPSQKLDVILYNIYTYIHHTYIHIMHYYFNIQRSSWRHNYLPCFLLGNYNSIRHTSRTCFRSTLQLQMYYPDNIHYVCTPLITITIRHDIDITISKIFYFMSHQWRVIHGKRVLAQNSFTSTGHVARLCMLL